MNEKQAPTTAPVPLVTLAHIDPEGILLSYDRNVPAPETLPQGVVIVPTGCDHAPGCARWNASLAAWEAIRPLGPEEQVEQPHALRAIHAGFVSLAAAGHKFPVDTLAWMDWHARSIDAAPTKKA